MASAGSEPRGTIVINDDTDTETDAPRPPPRELRRKRRVMDYSLPEYEALFDDPVPTGATPASEMSPPPKKRKVLNLFSEAANQGINEVVDAKDAKIKKLEEQVQRLHGEMSRKNEQVSGLEAEACELRH
ncbi:hypothetical protein LOZ66_005602 [Ophidiomyces ophidiicola]|nr:hypothetical protein LOZ65_006523 [Ophidiomyces ophidiicola]KAI1934747.1 hypothetical protein LOZ66_005602 [Ophidiomyces ophidiicola]